MRFKKDRSKLSNDSTMSFRRRMTVLKHLNILLIFPILLRWRRKWQPTLVSLLGESPWTEELGGLQSMGITNGWT